jgi:hypothetical protein
MASEITFTPSEKDYADANRESLRAQLRRPRHWLTLVLLILFGAGIAAGVTWLDGGREVVGPMAISFAVAVGIGVAVVAALTSLVIYVTTYLLLPRRAGRLYAQQKTLQQPWTYAWSEAGLSVDTVNGHALYPWPDFHRWLVSRRMVLLFLNDQLFFFLPRRLLDDSAVEELRSLVAASSVARV